MNPISKFIDTIIGEYFNKWTGIHFLFSLGICWSLKWFVDPILAFGTTFGIAILWEVYEYYKEGLRPYGDLETWFKDSIADLVVCLISCFVILV